MKGVGMVGMVGKGLKSHVRDGWLGTAVYCPGGIQSTRERRKAELDSPVLQHSVLQH